VKVHACTQGGCTVAEDGQCLEGLTVDECPYHKWLDADVGSEDGTEPEVAVQAAAAPAVTFEDGRYLDATGTRDLMRRTLARVVVLAGEVRCGKTTILASLMDAFHKGPYAGLLFAGSRTLPGFEQICHHARTGSGRMEPFTPRTSRSEELRFLHLNLAEEHNPRVRHTLLFSDISGEAFEAARESVDEAQALTQLRRADHLLVLVDGRKLLDPVERQPARRHPMSLLRNLLDAGVVESTSFVDVAVSKWDYIAATEPDSAPRRAVDRIREEVASRVEPYVGRARLVTVAARPRRGSEVEPRHGVDKLLRSWVYEAPRLRSQAVQLPPVVTGGREYTRFQG
jgi:hypothetical protein